MEQVNIDPYVSSPCSADWLISQFRVCQRIFCVVGFGTCFFMFLFFGTCLFYFCFLVHVCCFVLFFLSFFVVVLCGKYNFF